MDADQQFAAYMQEIERDERAGRFSASSVLDSIATDRSEESEAWKDAAIEHSERANSAERHCDAWMIVGSFVWILLIVVVAREIMGR